MKQNWTEKEQQQFNEAMDSLAEWEREVWEHNNAVLIANNIPMEDFMSITEDVAVPNKIEVVEKPTGTDNCEDAHGVFTAVFVDQRSVGDSGDSYAGNIYGHFGINKWLKIPYEC